MSNYNLLTDEEKRQFIQEIESAASQDDRTYQMLCLALNYFKEMGGKQKPVESLKPINHIP